MDHKNFFSKKITGSKITCQDNVEDIWDRWDRKKYRMKETLVIQTIKIQ